MSNVGDGDKRSVNTDALATLGTIIGENEKRDAIHLAVVPAIAGAHLLRGQDVRLVDGHAIGSSRAAGVGIVDPFLEQYEVKPGQSFWLIIYPRKITSLRHVWSHPAFSDEPEAETVAATTVLTAPRCTREESEAWLRDYCKNNDCPEYETTIKAAIGEYQGRYNNDGEYLTFYGRNAHAEIPPEFWEHVEAATGEKVPAERRASWFSCSC